MRQYKWKFDKLTALAVACINCIFVIYIVIRFMTDSYFFMTQTGFHLSQSMIVGISVLVLVLTIYANLKFLQKNHRARLLIGLFQTVGLACILRNIFVGNLYFGFDVMDYIRNLFSFAVVAALIYHTIFSKQIRTYYEEVIKRS